MSKVYPGFSRALLSCLWVSIVVIGLLIDFSLALYSLLYWLGWLPLSEHHSEIHDKNDDDTKYFDPAGHDIENNQVAKERVHKPDIAKQRDEAWTLILGCNSATT